MKLLIRSSITILACVIVVGKARADQAITSALNQTHGEQLTAQLRQSWKNIATQQVAVPMLERPLAATKAKGRVLLAQNNAGFRRR